MKGDPEPDSDRLESWKEIAAYLKRDVRTLRRWEKEQGLPVHRHHHNSLASVYAFKSELDRWRTARAPAVHVPETVNAPTPAPGAWVVGAALVFVLLVVLTAVVWLRPSTTARDALKFTQLTFNPAERPVTAAAVSPDGKYLAFKDELGLAVHILASGQHRRVSLPPDLTFAWLAWLPDSTQLVLSGPTGLWLTSIFGDAPRRIASAGGMVSVAPNGRYIGVTAPSGASITVHGVTGEQVSVTPLPAGSLGVSRTTWSRTSSRFAYSHRRQTAEGVQNGIETRRADGSAPTRIYTGPVHDLAWAPGRVLFARPEPPPKARYTQVWEIPVDDESGEARGEPRQITEVADFSFRFPTLTADGGRMVFVVNDVRLELYTATYDSATRSVANLVRQPLPATEGAPSGWSPDNNALLFRATTNGRFSFHELALGRPEPREFVASPSASVWDAVYAPDGNFVLHTSTEGKPRVMRAPRTGGTSTEVFELPGDARTSALKCAVTPSSRCVASWVDGGRLKLVAFDATNGQPRTLPHLPAPVSATSWALSPDGWRIVSVDGFASARQLTVLDTATGDTRAVVTPALDGAEFVVWVADGWLVTRSVGDRGSELLHLTHSGTSRVVWSSNWQRLILPVISPDGTRLAFASQSVESRVWMLERF